MTISRSLLGSSLLVAASLALAACGGDDTTNSTGVPGSGGGASTSSTASSGGGSSSSTGGQGGAGGSGGVGGGATGVGGAGGAATGSGGSGGSSTTGGGGDGGSSSSSSTTGSGGAAPGCDLDHLVISEVRSRGPKGGNDDFIEIHNPTSASVTLDATWKVSARSFSAQKYTDSFVGSGQVLAAGGYFLIANKDPFYAGPKGNAAMDIGINDAGSIMIEHGGATIDAVCYFHTPGSKATIAGAGYICEGAPVDNTVHASSATGNIDASFERKACTDSGDNAADFTNIDPSTAHPAP